MYYTYVIRCEDNSLYTGITTDLERRMKEHFEKNEKCAKYTFRHNAKKLEMVWTSNDRKLASKLEYHIKKLPKIKKENLIKSPELLNEYLGDKIDSEEYKVYER